MVHNLLVTSCSFAAVAALLSLTHELSEFGSVTAYIATVVHLICCDTIITFFALNAVIVRYQITVVIKVSFVRSLPLQAPGNYRGGSVRFLTVWRNKCMNQD